MLLVGLVRLHDVVGEPFAQEHQELCAGMRFACCQLLAKPEHLPDQFLMLLLVLLVFRVAGGVQHALFDRKMHFRVFQQVVENHDPHLYRFPRLDRFG